MTRRAAALALLGLLLTGCWSRIEVNDLAVVGVVAMDREPDGNLRLSLQIVLPTRIPRPSGGSDGGGSGGGGRAVHVVSASARTILDAARKLQLQMPRRLFWAHAAVFLVGERLAATGLQPVEDFLTRYREIRPHAVLLVVRGDPLDLLRVTPAVERMPLEAIRELERSRTGLAVTINEFTRTNRLPGQDPALAWLGTAPPAQGRPEQDGGTRDFRLQGSALFAGDRLAGWLDEAQTLGLIWLQGRSAVGVLTAPAPGAAGFLSVEVVRGESRREVVWEGARPTVRMRVTLETVLHDLEVPLNLEDPAVLVQVQHALEREVTALVRSSLEQARALGVDPFGLGELVRRSDPTWWQERGGRWREEIRTLPVAVAAEVNVRKIGVASRTHAGPEGELIRR